MNETHAGLLGTAVDWNILLERIERGNCTPFVGAETNLGNIPPRSQIAKELADEFHYPLQDSDNLARVTQFIVTTRDERVPRDKIADRYEQTPPPDFDSTEELHRVLAQLPLPVYVTTDYDNYMFEALKRARKDPKREFCRWRKDLQEDPPNIFDTDYLPTPANPVVFHLHGYAQDPNTLVLTEDDYLDFLAVSRDTGDSMGKNRIIPAHIERAFTQRCLLFLGYRFGDLEFRVLLRSLVTAFARNKYRHITVQFVQDLANATEEEKTRQRHAQEYLASYCEKEPRSQVYWGTTRDFVAELRQRWEAFRRK
ncbi:MAG: SIR2 family protein [Verrucomicrobia bacterium]|nr:SIR2 family protein [Verrucomicrobiota bacterium]